MSYWLGYQGGADGVGCGSYMSRKYCVVEVARWELPIFSVREDGILGEVACFRALAASLA